MRIDWRGRGALAVALIVVLAVLLGAGLWPLDFRPRNQVQWMTQGPGLRFGRRAIAYSVEPLRWNANHSGVTLEIWLEPGEELGSRLAEILSFHDGDAIAPLLIAQWKSGLILRDRIEAEAGARPYRELGKLGILARGQRRFIAVASGADGTAVFVDEALKREIGSTRPVIAAGESFGGRLLLGNSATGKEAWSGVLYGVAVYARRLSPEEIANHGQAVRGAGLRALAGEPDLLALYPLDEGRGDTARSLAGVAGAIRIPEVFQPLVRQPLQLPRAERRNRRRYEQDLALNILGFVPLGFLFFLIIRRSSQVGGKPLAAAVILLGAGLSLGIELTQVYLPGRVSSASDLVANTLGTALGGLFASWSLHRNAH